MTENWLSLAKAVEAIEARLDAPTGLAQVELIQACATGKVRSIERNPEHGKEDIDWWELDIPASDWQASDAHIDRSTGEARLNGQTFGTRMITKDCGRDADGRIVLQAWMAQVLISSADLKHWLEHRDTPAVKPTAKKGRPPRQLEQARAALDKLREDGFDVDKETIPALIQLAKERGYTVSERTLRRVRGGK